MKLTNSWNIIFNILLDHIEYLSVHHLNYTALGKKNEITYFIALYVYMSRHEV